MDKRKLGKTGLEIAPLVFGGNVFGWTADEATSFALLDAFIGHGFNAIDTADVYSRWAPGNAGGKSETIIGNWLKNRGNRDRVVIVTKVGSEMGPGKSGLSKAYIVRAVETRCAVSRPTPSISISRTGRIPTRRSSRRSRPISASSSRGRSEAREDRTTTLPVLPRRLRQARLMRPGQHVCLARRSRATWAAGRATP